MSNPSTDDQPSGAVDRSSARLSAVQALYEIDMTGVAADPVIKDFLTQRWKATPDLAVEGEDDISELAQPDTALLAELVRGVSAKRDVLDGMIAPSLSGEWTVERLEVLLRAILRAGAFELLAMTDVPARVIINEYVELARDFFGEDEPAMVNAVLDKIARQLREAEQSGT